MFALVLFASVCTMQWLRPDGFAVREAIRRAAKEELTLLELDMKKIKQQIRRIRRTAEENAILHAAANEPQDPEELRSAVQKLERASELLRDASISISERR